MTTLLISARIIVPITLPVVAIALITRIGDPVFGRYETWKLLASAVALFLVISLAATWGGSFGLGISSGALTRQVLVAFGVFVLTVGALSRPPPAMVAVSAFALVIAAFVEEYVFRWMIPRRLTSAFSEAGVRPRLSTVVGFVIAQFVFVVCHFFPATHDAYNWPGVGRLFSAGIMYGLVVVSSGLGVAAGVHAAMNFTLLIFPK